METQSQQSQPAPELKPSSQEKLISIKLAALESFKLWKKIRLISVMGLIGMFMVALFAILSRYVSFASVAVLGAFFGWFLYDSKRKISYLQNTYGVR